MSSDYFTKLRTASEARNSMLCIGLDPDPSVIDGGASGAVNFCRRLIDSTSDVACCYKPNAAFWEQYGPEGWEALLSIRDHVPRDIPVLFDCKRADVPRTMAAYATAVYQAMDFDAATVHAYHGEDSLREFTKYKDRGVYVVCHTSNGGRANLQDLECGQGKVYTQVARIASSVSANRNVGVVMGATSPYEIHVIRKAYPALPFLLPGIGRQGGDLESSVRAGFTEDLASCLIAVAGAIMYDSAPRRAAQQWRDRINRVRDITS